MNRWYIIVNDSSSSPDFLRNMTSLNTLYAFQVFLFKRKCLLMKFSSIFLLSGIAPATRGEEDNHRAGGSSHPQFPVKLMIQSVFEHHCVGFRLALSSAWARTTAAHQQGTVRCVLMSCVLCKYEQLLGFKGPHSFSRLKIHTLASVPNPCILFYFFSLVVRLLLPDLRMCDRFLLTLHYYSFY